MLKIALVGYGKMGRAIEKIALQRGHTISQIFNRTPEVSELNNSDVAIEFSRPDAAFENIKNCLSAGIPTLSGTTGWLNKLPEIHKLCNEKNGTFLYASNFSLGVNLFFQLNKFLAKMMGRFPEYSPKIDETHHTQKLDAPSGTAISLAQGIIENSSFSEWKLNQETKDNQLGIFAHRVPDVPGTHTITYTSTIDEISITHTAFSREGFALGAVLAAEQIIHKKGIISIEEIFGI